MAKKNADAAIKPVKDRFLRSEKRDNLYVTFALYFLMVFMSFMLVFVYMVAMCEVDGISMNPSLADKDNLLMLKNPTSFKVGDVVTFRAKDPVEGVVKPLIKRVIAVGGDEVVFIERKGTPYVDLYRKAAGTDKFLLMEEDSYAPDDMLKEKINVEKFSGKIAPDATAESMEKYKMTVDKGYLFVLGDNRNNSLDSRRYGLIPEKDVRGKMFYRLTKGSLLERLLLLIYTDRAL